MIVVIGEQEKMKRTEQRARKNSIEEYKLK